MTKLLAFHGDKQNEKSSPLGQTFDFEGISHVEIAVLGRAYATMSTRPKFTCTQLGYALIVSQPAPGKRFKLATLARRICANITPARYALWQCVAANAAHASRRSGLVLQVPKQAEFDKRLKGRLALDLPFSLAIPHHLIPDCSGTKGLPEVWAFRAATLELGQRGLLGQHIPTDPVLHRAHNWACGCCHTQIALHRELSRSTIATTGRRNVKRARNRMLHETSAGMPSAFSSLADEQSTPPSWRRLLGSYPENLRTAAARASRSNRTRDCDVCLLGNRLRQPQEYLRLLRTPLCVSSAVGSPDTAVATVWRS